MAVVHGSWRNSITSHRIQHGVALHRVVQHYHSVGSTLVIIVSLEQHAICNSIRIHLSRYVIRSVLLCTPSVQWSCMSSLLSLLDQPFQFRHFRIDQEVRMDCVLLSVPNGCDLDPLCCWMRRRLLDLRWLFTFVLNAVYSESSSRMYRALLERTSSYHHPYDKQCHTLLSS